MADLGFKYRLGFKVIHALINASTKEHATAVDSAMLKGNGLW